MKSLNFTKLKKKLVSGEKQQTIRCIFIPTFEENEVIQIKFKKKPLFQAKITEIYPKKVNEINQKEAIADGFENIDDCIKCLLEINNLKSSNHFCFIIKFKPIAKITDFIEK